MTAFLKRFNKHFLKSGLRQFFINNPLKLCSQIEITENVEFDPEIVKREYEVMLSECLDKSPHRCYVIQPYIKWGPSKVTNRSPEQRLNEATQLVNFLDKWQVIGGESLGVRSTKYTLGSGQLRNVSNKIKRLGITAVVVNIPLLNKTQIDEMSSELYGIKFFDRASIVLRLVREQVTNGTHAHVQLQLAELDYVSRRYKDERSQIVLNARRLQLIALLDSHKEQRELLRKKRKNNDLPIVAVIGYTNAGKSSLVSALVNTKVCSVSAKAFHTLDVFARAGQLPSGLRILYMDTVGFLSDIPNLIAPLFNATLEDVLLADVLLHVVDTSHEEVAQQKNHVVNELKQIYASYGQAIPPIITVGNKLDLRPKNFAQNDSKVAQDDLKVAQNDLKVAQESLKDEWDLAVSALHDIGIDALRLRLEEEVLRATKRSIVNIRVLFGSEEVRWLYKNSVVLDQVPDKNNAQSCILKVIITKAKIDQFYSYFVKKQ